LQLSLVDIISLLRANNVSHFVLWEIHTNSASITM
jgi:hypothetical protein